MFIKKEYRLLPLQEVSQAYMKTFSHVGLKNIKKQTFGRGVFLSADTQDARVSVRMEEKRDILPSMKHLGKVPIVTLEMQIQSLQTGAPREEEIAGQIENGLWLYLPGHGG